MSHASEWDQRCVGSRQHLARLPPAFRQERFLPLRLVSPLSGARGLMPIRCVEVGQVGVISQALSLAPGSAPLVAMLAALPLLWVCYVRYLIAVSKCRPEFSLRIFESIELKRTILVYGKVSRRLKEICCECRQEAFTWRVLNRSRHNSYQIGEELEDLKSFARDLRLTIIRLRGRPFRRYKSWAHLVSVKFALGCLLWCYSLILVLLLAVFCYFEPILWAPGIRKL
jgi:hypothetical protein